MSYGLRCLRFVLSIALLSVWATNVWANIQAADYDAAKSVVTVNVNGSESNYDLVTAIANDSGRAVFALEEGQAFLSNSGQPQIPFQTIELLLPPDADLDTVKTSIKATYDSLTGTWDISPMPPLGSWDDQGNEVIIWPQDANIIDGYDADIYGSDALWPPVSVKEVSKGQLRSYKLVEVAFPLYQYNPATGEISRLSSADITIKAAETASSSTFTTKAISSAAGNSIITDRVKNLAANYSDVASQYGSEINVKSPTITDTGYVIVTTNTIKNSSSKLADFIADKEASGFQVSVITENQYGTGSGDTAANNVRAWLTANYNNSAYGSGGILYALIIGDPRTTSSSVPMKMCVDLPTDYFYAELTGDWDGDGDGIYGEEEELSDKYFEIYVGRIPYYGNVSETDAILEKLIDYNNETDTAWRRNALLPMVPLDDATQGYQCGEQIKYDLLEPQAITSDRIYHANYGLSPKPEYLLEESYPANVWANGIYGMVIWMTHGNTTFAGEVISSGSQTDALNNDYPSVVFQGSCLTGHPETTNNVGYSILKNGGIGTVAASRNGIYWVGETNFTHTSSVGGIGYQYSKYLANNKTVGQSIWNAKEYLSFWWQNYLVYNLYGDPSISIIPEMPDYTVTPTHGTQYDVIYGGTVDASSTYTLNNDSSGSISWTAYTSGANWFSLSEYSGTINAHGSKTVTITVNESTADLPVGSYEETIIFTNKTTNESFERTVTLTVCPKSIVAYWPFEETSGETAHDYSGNGYNGTTVNNDFSSNSADGKSGKCFYFDSTNHIEVHDMVEDMTEMTISAWVYAVDWNGNRRILQKGGDGSEYRLLVENSRFVFQIGSSSLRISELPETEKWVHIAAVYDGSEMRVYYDQVLKGSLNRTGVVPSGSGTLFFGTKNEDSSATDRLFGGIDELRIYNYAKSEQGISDLYLCKDMAEALNPFDGAGEVLLVPTLKWAMGLSAASNDVYFGTDYQAVLNANIDSDEYKGRQSSSEFAPGTLRKNSTYYWRVDQVDAGGNITEGIVWVFFTGDGVGGITWQAWTGISGNTLTNLLNDSDYPNNPDTTDMLDSFEGPTNWAENYGSRVIGFFIPPVSGSYTFWIASDDYSELYFSTDDTMANAQKIAYLNGASGTRQWDMNASQQSAEITLVAGNPYFIAALHKEGAVGDHLSVAFSGPGISQRVIPGQYLMPYADDYIWGPRFNGEKFLADNAAQGIEYTSYLSDAVSSGEGELTFTKLTGPGWLTVSAEGTMSGLPATLDIGRNLFEVQVSDSYGETDTVIVQINVIDVFNGEFGLIDFAGLASMWLEGECLDSACNGADLTGDGYVTIDDVELLAGNWLVAGQSSGLSLYWPFDTDGTEEKMGYNADPVGAYIANEGASYELYSGSLQFDGIDDYAIAGGTKGITGTASRSCMAWVKTSADSDGTILSWGSDSQDNKWVFRVEASGSIGVAVWGGTVNSDVTVNDGQWHHVAAVLIEDEDCSVSDVKFYVDGELCSSMVSQPGAIDTTAGQDIIIGAVNVGGNQIYCFDGMIDEVKVCDWALTPEDIAIAALKPLALSIPMNEAAGSVAADLSTYGRAGTLVNGPVWSSGIIGSCLDFDGTNDYLLVNGYTGISGSVSRSCSAWVNTTSSDAGSIISWGSDDFGQKWMFRMEDGGTTGLTVWGGDVSGDIAVNDGQWHHVVAVLESDSDADMTDIKLYVDGQLCKSSVVYSGSINTVPGQDVTIGAINVNGNIVFNFDGKLDEVKVFEYALSSEEVEKLYNQVQ